MDDFNLAYAKLLRRVERLQEELESNVPVSMIKDELDLIIGACVDMKREIRMEEFKALVSDCDDVDDNVDIDVKEVC